MPGTHALLSASGSARWMNCPPSARIEERYRAIFGEGTSPFAEEGTKAHALAELKLKVELGNIDPDQGINEYAYGVEREKLGEISREMDNATDYYKDLIIEKFLTARKTCPDARLFIEQKLDFSEWVPEGFGTGDAVIISDDICEVCDFKYGKGVPVSAENNPQARCYGLGALQLYGMLYDFDVIRNTIIQPRLDSVTEETLTREQLYEWAEMELKPKAHMAWNGLGEFKPGAHCRFCAAKALCYSRALQAMTVFKDAFERPDTIPTEDIPQILDVADNAIAWLKDLQDWAFEQAKKGQEFKGYKLVHGRRPPRRWVDEAKAMRKLVRYTTFKKKDFETKTMKTVADIEKMIGKQDFEKFADLATQAEGKLTLVPASDKRPAYSSAEADFSDLV